MARVYKLTKETGVDLEIPDIFPTNQELLKNFWQIHDIFPKSSKFLMIPDIPYRVDTQYFCKLPYSQEKSCVGVSFHAFLKTLQMNPQ